MSYFISISYVWIIPTVAVALASLALRVVRWRMILESDRKISFWSAFHPLMIGFMLNCIMPGRVGEVARPIILLQKEKIPFSIGLTTVAVERFFDLVFLIGFFIFVFASVNIDPKLNIAFGGHYLNKETLLLLFHGMLNVCILLIAAMLLISWKPGRILIQKGIMAAPLILFFLEEKQQDKIGEKVCRPLKRTIENIAIGFALIKDPIRLLSCAGLSLLIWLLSAYSYYILAIGCPGITLTFKEILAFMVILLFFVALPSVPGFWGIWEAGGVFALYLFGVSNKDAAGFALISHVVQMAPVIIIGLLSALYTGIDILKFPKLGSNDPKVQ